MSTQLDAEEPALARRPAAVNRAATGQPVSGENRTAGGQPIPDGTGGGDSVRVRTVIVGTGFSGLGAAIRLARTGERDFVVLERADDLGGTWRDNVYPGCRCDVPSNLYSFSFAPNPDWTSTYAPQEEIWAYLQKTAERGGVPPHVRWGHDVEEAAWDEAESRWQVRTSLGHFSCQLLVLATGALTEPLVPAIPGLAGFEGATMHSARWDGTRPLAGERVAVIGTGASAAQIVPALQPVAGQLLVFQRTAPWVVRHPGRLVPGWRRRLFRAAPLTQRASRAATYWSRELLVLVFGKATVLRRMAERQARRHLRRQVPDPALRRALTPAYELGCKRVLPSNDFYPALAAPNVTLVTEPIAEVRPHSIVTADGTEHHLDAIIFGTGFHVTDNPMATRVRGRGGCRLNEVIGGRPGSYLGTTFPGFPNLFMMTGPNTGLGHSSMVFMIESQLNYLMDACQRLDEAGMDWFEPTTEAAIAFNRRLQERLPRTVWASGCSSWYLDAEGRNVTLWPGFSFTFRRLAKRFRPADHAMGRQRVAAARR